MLESYLPLILMIVIGFIVAISFMFLSEILGAKRSTAEKQTTYESGMVPRKTAHERFSVKFYMVAVSFIVFDIEVVFMYPWAVQLGQLGLAAFWAMILFIVILFVGYFYEYKRGGFQWD
ncbi:MAG TPA: NADH-quinone oxidoreductase subunit A [Candidatus Kapabacteria bacterium]|nr:NADH-quinone oxidoreductase subunit A [Candidatus Kapabacteria bacterium]